MPYCPNCGEPVDDRSRYCRNCGTDVSDVPRESGGHNGSGENERTQTGHDEWGGPRQPGQGDDQHTDRRGSAGGQQHGSGPQGGQQPGTPGRGPSNALDFSFSFPKQNGWMPVLISTVLALFSFLIVPAILLAGYGFRVARWAAADQAQPPTYSDWGGLVVDGVRFGLLSVLTGFGFFLIYVLTFGGVFGATAVGDPTGELFVLILPLFVLGYVGIFVLVNAVMTVFVGNDSLVGAFTDGRLISLLKSWYFYKAFVFFVALNIIFQMLFFVSILTIVGPLVVNAYMILAFGAYWGYVYREAASRSIVPPATGIANGQQRQQPQY